MPKAFKPSQQQLTAMRFLARAFPIVWVPHELDSFSPEHPEVITARKLVPALRSLYAKGFAKPYPKLGKWACVMTLSGMKAFENATGQEGLVERAKTAWLAETWPFYATEEDAHQAWLQTPGVHCEHRYPRVNEHYALCLNLFGDQGRWPNPAMAHLNNDPFVVAVDAGYQNATLHGCGYLAIRLADKKPVFLVCVRVDNPDALTDTLLANLSAQYQVAVTRMEEDPYDNLPGYSVITATLERIDQLSIAYPLVADITKADVTPHP